MSATSMTGPIPAFVFAALALMAACTAPPVPTALPTPAPPSTAMPSPPPSETATAETPPTRSATATPIAVPGFDGWTVLNPGAVEIAVEGDALILTLKRRALWFMSERGVLFSHPVTGDFKITAIVSAARSSDPARPPAGSVQLGGLMARDGQGGPENYVFIVVGHDSDGLSVETKTTQDGVSEWKGPGWGSGLAELRLCRFGSDFHLYKRLPGTPFASPLGTRGQAGEAWTLAESFERPDLPDTLQAGVNIYSDSRPDLQVRYEALRIEPVQVEADCLAD